MLSSLQKSTGLQRNYPICSEILGRIYFLNLLENYIKTNGKIYHIYGL